MSIEKDKIVNLLIADYSLKPRGQFLREGRCPQCNKKSLFISANDPFNLKCGRDNKCGWQIKTRELYPECFKPLHISHPATPKNPNATANEYMRKRGFDLVQVSSWFDQAQRVETKAISEPNATETVRFYLDDKKQLPWHRYIVPIEMESGPKKAHFEYGKNYIGRWWTPPQDSKYKIDFSNNKSVWLVEGIFDAMALNFSGRQAVSLMSCNNVITLDDTEREHDIRAYFNKGIRWVVALDNDKAGKSYALRFFKYLESINEDVQLAIIPTDEKRDWNDAFQANKGKIPLSFFNDCLYEGDLLSAKSAKAKALTMFAKTKRHKFPFEYALCLWWAEIEKGTSTDNAGEQTDAVKLSKLSNCLPEFLYFQKDPEQIEAKPNYYLRVKRAGAKREYKEVFKNTDISTAQAFKNQLYATGSGLMFTGNTQQLDSYIEQAWFNDPNPPEITALNFIGYAKEAKAWVFTDHAICNGEFIKVNNQDYFDLPDDNKIKTNFRVNPLKLSSKHAPELWLEDFKLTFGNNGLMALAYWFGTYFAEQMRSNFGQWPFLELSGDPGTGKTRLLEFLWKLSGRDEYEGVDLAKASHAGRWRTFSQLANLPTVIIEGDRDEGGKSRTFDIAETKPLYNGRGMRITGAMTGSNETIEPPFRSALVIAQNAEIDTVKPVMERIVHCHFDKSGHSHQGFLADRRLKDLDIEKINGFLPAATMLEKKVMERLKKLWPNYIERLSEVEAFKNQRIKDNHAQIMACAQTMSDLGLVPLKNDELADLFEHVKERCKERHESIVDDHPLVIEFWDMISYLEASAVGKYSINHSPVATQVAINFPQLENVAREFNQSLGNKTEIKRLLKSGRVYTFDGYRALNSAVNNKKTKCFIFNRPNNTGAKIL